MTGRFIAASAALALLFAFTPTARADESAAAVSLFDEGNRLYEAGNFDAACPKYEASLRLDASSIDTRGRLALCYEKTGRLASAWSAWREVKARASRSLGRERAVDIAASHIAELEPKLGRLVLHAKAALPPGATVSLDGAPFPLESFDVAMAADKGRHHVEVSASGYKPWSGEASLDDGKQQVLEVGPLEKLPEPPPEAHTTPPAGPSLGSSSAAPMVRHEPASSTRKWIGISALGLGVVALGVAGFEGLDAMSKRDDADKAGCDHDLSNCMNPDALKLANDSYSAANLATGLAIGGAAVAVTGIILWASAPGETVVIERTAWHVTPSVGGHQAGLVLSGAF